MNTQATSAGSKERPAPHSCGIAGKLLGAYGLMGLPTWLLLSAFAWLFRGFKPGALHSGPNEAQGWLCVVVPSLTFAYYFLVSAAIWNPRWYVSGLILNGVYLFAVATLVVSTDVGMLIAPVMLAGPVLWFLHAMRMQRQSPNAAGAASDAHEPPTS